jgi:hypothetical protein
MSTQQPFKFRHLDSIVGGFVLAAVAIVIIALALIGSARQWFTPKTEIEARTGLAKPEDGEFYEELAANLKPGTPVELSGKVVGTVLSSDARAGIISLKLEIATSALDLLHQGEPAGRGRAGEAKAQIKAPIATFMGQPRIVLKPGSSGVQGWTKDKWHENNALTLIPDRDTTALAMAVLRDVKDNLGPMLVKITGLVDESHKLVAEIRAQRLPQQAGELVAGLRERQVPQRLDALLERIGLIAASVERLAQQGEGIASDAKRISGGLAEGKGIAGRALTDQQLAEDLAKLAGDLRAITAELRTAAPAAPALAEGAGTLLDEVQRLVDGLNRHWLLKSYTEPGSGARIVPPGIIDAPEAKP